jgi:hypothetical protein
MRFLRIALSVAVTVGASLGVITSSASAGAFCSNVLLQAGGTNDLTNTCIHGASHAIHHVDATASTNAMSCAGGTNHSNTPDWIESPPCCPYDMCMAEWAPYGTLAYPALHNHSTHQGRFDGYFQIY